MSDEDEMKVADCSRHEEAQWAREFIPLVIPGVEATLMELKSFHESLPIFHNILAFVTISIHPILMSAMSPPQLSQPSACCAFRNRWPVDASLCVTDCPTRRSGGRYGPDFPVCLYVVIPSEVNAPVMWCGLGHEHYDTITNY